MMVRSLLLLTLTVGSCALRLPIAHEAHPEAKDIKLFCFAWITNRPKELATLPDMKQQLSACDGHAIFGNGIQDPDVIKVPEAPSDIIGRTLAHLIPTWKHLLFKSPGMEHYDWVLNVEWDHLVRPSQVKLNIARDLGVLQRGTEAERASTGKAMMLMWGNSFVFNQKLTQEMRRQWSFLGKTKSTTLEDNGCPEWYDGDQSEMRERKEGGWEGGRCAQDNGYPHMVTKMSPPVAAYGKTGCNQIAKNGLGEEFHLACYNVPIGGTKLERVPNQLKLIAAIANGQPKGVKYFGASGTQPWHQTTNLKEVPIFHRVYDPEVHQLSRELLKL